MGFGRYAVMARRHTATASRPLLAFPRLVERNTSRTAQAIPFTAAVPKE